MEKTPTPPGHLGAPHDQSKVLPPIHSASQGRPGDARIVFGVFNDTTLNEGKGSLELAILGAFHLEGIFRHLSPIDCSLYLLSLASCYSLTRECHRGVPRLGYVVWPSHACHVRCWHGHNVVRERPAAR